VNKVQLAIRLDVSSVLRTARNYLERTNTCLCRAAAAVVLSAASTMPYCMPNAEQTLGGADGAYRATNPRSTLERWHEFLGVVWVDLC
jgi:hypothetical protein